MKIAPLPANGISSANLSTGRTGSPNKIQMAKALAAGEQPPLYQEPQVQYLEPGQDVDIKRIKMRTNHTTSRDVMESMPQQDVAQPDVFDVAAEETKPLDPQLAAIAKHRRALQVKERELADREKALSAQNPQGSVDMLARLKSSPLSVLQEAGVTYDQLTEAILASSQGAPDINQIKEETLKALDERLNKTLQDRDAQTEQQVLRDMAREAEAVAQVGDDFELIRTTRSVPDVVELIHRTYKKTGEVLGVREAMALVEEDLLDETLKVVSLKKIQGRLQPSQPPLPPQQRMRTLTNRDSAAPPMTARQRALAAFHGTLKK